VLCFQSQVFGIFFSLTIHYNRHINNSKTWAVLLRLRNSERIGWLIDCLIDHVYGVIHLRTAATTRPIVHPPGDVWTWTAMVMTMSAGENSWLVYQSSLTILPAETHGSGYSSNGRKSENFAYYYLRYVSRSVTCRKILTTWDLRLPLQRKVCCGFVSFLKIHRLVRVWTCDPWAQWQAQLPLHHRDGKGCVSVFASPSQLPFNLPSPCGTVRTRGTDVSEEVTASCSALSRRHCCPGYHLLKDLGLHVPHVLTEIFSPFP
jgi:hypothetical protein